MDQRIARAYWGDDCIINSLGFSTREVVEGIENYSTGLTIWHDGTPVCLIDRQRLNKEIAHYKLEDYTHTAQLAILALKNINAHLEGNRSVLILSTTKGDIEYLNSSFETCYLSSLAQSIVRYFAMQNEAIIISNACISGVSAIITGARLIETGMYDHVYVVGVDTLNDFIISGFNAFKSVSAQICRPYDAARNGLTLGEGCAAVHLTNDRELSGNKILVAGGGISNDANHISGPSRTGDGLYFSIQEAMERASLLPNAAGFINTHGTATLFNDEMESKALNLSGLLTIPCNSLKPYFGHTLGASGVIESILAAHQLHSGIVYGVKGYETCGVPYPLNISAQHRHIEMESCIKTASGFGGCNAALVLCKETLLQKNTATKTVGANGESSDTKNVGANTESNATKTATANAENAAATDRKIVVTGHVEISQNEEMPFGEYIRMEYKLLQDSNLKFAKMDDLCKLGYVAAGKLLAGRELPYPAQRIAIILANKSASLESDLKHQAIVNQHNPQGASPAVFVYTLPNIVAGEIAIRHKIKGENTFFVFPDKNLKFARTYAHNLLKNNHADAVLYGWCELLGQNYNAELFLLEKS